MPVAGKLQIQFEGETQSYDVARERVARTLDDLHAQASRVTQLIGAAFTQAGGRIAPAMDGPLASVETKLHQVEAVAQQTGGAMAQLTARVTENRAAAALYGTAILDNRAKMLELVQAIEQAKSAENADEEQVKQLTAQLKQLSVETRSLIIDKGKLANETQGLRLALDAEKKSFREQEDAIRRVNEEGEKNAKNWKSLTDGIKNAGQQMSGVGRDLSIGVTAPLVAISAAALKTGADFDRSMSVIAANSDEAKLRLGELSARAIQLGADMTLPATSANNAAQAMLELIKAGMSVNDTLDASLATLRLSAAAQIDEAQAAQITAVALQQFGLAGSEAARVVDLLAASASASSLEITDVANSLKYVGPIAHELKIPIEDVITAITELAKAGIKGEQAGTALRGILVDLNPTSRQAKEAMKALGVEIFDSQGKMKSFDEVIDQMHKALSSLSDKQREQALATIFGKEQMTAAGVIFGQGAQKFKELETEVTKAGVAQEQAAARSKGLGGALDGLQSQVETVGLALSRLASEPLENMVRKFADAVPKIVETGIALAAAHPHASLFAAVMLGVAAVAGPVLIGLGTIVTFLGGPLSIAIAGAIVWIGALVTAYIENAGGLKTAVDGLVRQLNSIFGGHGEVMTALGWLLHQVFEMWAQDIANIVNVARFGIAVLTGDFGQMWQLLKDMSHSGAKDTVAATESGLSGLPGAWQHQLDQVKQMLAQANGQYAAMGAQGGQAYVDAVQQRFRTVVLHAPQQQAGKFDVFGKDPFSVFTAPPPAQAEQKGQETGEELIKRYLKGLDTGFKKGRGGAPKLTNAILDVFQGDGGFDRAITYINENVAKLTKLFDPATKSFRAGGEEMKRALTEVAKEINDFLAASGVKVKVNAEDLAASWGKFQGVIGKTDVFERVRAAIQEMNLDSVSRGLETLDDRLQVVDGQIVVSADTLRGLQLVFPDLIEAVEQAGSAIVSELPKVANTSKLTAVAIALLTKENKQLTGEFAFDTRQNTAKAKLAWNELVSSLPIPQLKAQLAEIKRAFEGDPTLGAARLADEIQQQIDGAARAFERLGELEGKSGVALQEFVETKLRRLLSSMDGATEESVNKQIDLWKKLSIQLPGIWNDVFSHLSGAAKSWAASIFGVLDSIPSAFSSTVRKVQSTISEWVSFFNSILGLLHKFSSDIPASVGDAIGKLVSIFKGGANSSKDALGDLLDEISAVGAGAQGGTNKISNAVGGMSDKVKTGFGVAASAAAGFASSLAITANSSSKAMGFLEATISSTLAGIAAGFAFGPVAGAITAGVSLIGGIIGLFHKKSAAEKEKEQLQLQQMKADLQKTAQDVVNAAIDGFNKAFEFFQKLDDFTPLRQKAFNRFFTQMRMLMDEFVQLAKSWGKDSLDKAKALADVVGPVTEAVANGVAGLMALAGMTTVPQRAVDVFGAGLRAVITSFSQIVTDVGDEAITAAKRLSKRVAQTIQVVADGVQAFTGLSTFTGLPASQAQLFAAGMAVAITALGAVIGMLDGEALPYARALARRAADVVELIGNGVTALTGLATFSGITQTTADLFRDAMAAVIMAVAQAADLIDADLVAAAQRFADRAGSSVQLIGTAITSFKDLVTIKAAPAEALTALGEMIRLAVSILGDIASQISEEMASEASALAAKTGPIVTLIKDAVESFNALDSLQNVEGGPFDALKLYIRRAVQNMGDLASELSDELVSRANTFSGKIKSVFEALGSAVSVFNNLSNLAGGPDVAGGQFPDIGRILDFILNGVRAGVESIIKIAGEINAEGIASAVDFANKARTIFEAVSSGAAAFKAIAEIPGMSQSQWDSFMQYIRDAVGVFTEAAAQATKAYDLSVVFKQKLADAKDNISAGLDLLKQIAGMLGLTINLPSASGPAPQAAQANIAPQVPQAASFPRSSAPAASRRPATATAAAAGGDTYEFHFHSQVIGSNAEDWLLAALQKAQKKLRLS